jgi:hypothetical protein
MRSSMKVSENTFNYLTNLLKSRNSQAVYTKAFLRLGKVYFTDNTAWYIGKYLIPDPSVPGRWIPAPQQKQEKIGLRLCDPGSRWVHQSVSPSEIYQV